MRTNKTKRQLVMNVARIALLAMCFTLVFAFALAQDVFDIAEAAEAKQVFIEKDKDAVLGSVTPITGDHGELDAMDFDFGSSNKTTWTYNETFNTIEATTANHQASKESGDTKLYTWTGSQNNPSTGTVTPGVWNYGVSNAWAANSVFGIINYNPGNFVKQLLQRPDIRVYASYTASADMGSKVDHIFFRAARSAEGLPALDSKGKTNAESKGGTLTSNEIELTADEPILGVCVSIYFNYHTGDTNQWVRFWNLNVKLRIVMDTSVNIDSANIVDGSAPQVVSQYVSSVTDTYSPYLPTTDQVTKNSSWPIWYESIASQLSRYTDDVSFANGKLSSFTNTPMGTVNGKSFYKQSVVRYADSYDYSSSGGFSGATLQSIYQQAIAQGKSDEEAESAVRAVLPYMSLGWRKVDSIDMKNLDIANPAKNLTWNDNTADRFVAGIKTIQVGDPWQDMDGLQNPGAVINVTDMQVSNNVNKYPRTATIYVDGNEVGYVSVIKYNRAEVVVTISMYTNARVSTVITDNGGASNSTVVTYSGIDVSAPIVDETVNGGVEMDLSDYIAKESETSTLKWIREMTMSYGSAVNIYEDETAPGFAPYIWFYSVDKANSWNELKNKPKKDINDVATLKSADILPIACGNLNDFAYDFYNGCARSFGSSAYDAGNPAGMELAKGAGYYRFTFYTFDLAGNKGGEAQYYAKVDFEQPVYSATLSYIDANGQKVTINPSENGKWATGATTLSLFFPTPNFSGLSLIFEDVNASYMIVIDGSGEPAYGMMGGGNLVKYCTADGTFSPSGNKFDLNITTELQPITAKVSVNSIGNATEVEFVFDDVASTIAFISEFTAYAGQYSKTSDPDSDEMALGYVDRSWGSAVKVLVDRTNPANPELSDIGDMQYLYPLEGKYELPTERTWYTDGYNFDTALTFIEYLVGSDYAKGIKIYTGIKNVSNLEDLLALKNLNIESIYDTINEDNFKDYFDRLQVITGDLLDGDQTDVTINFIKEKGANMRVLYAWVVDQAGNFSGLNIYYILVDGNTYTINSNVLVNNLLGKTATISQTNAEEVTTTSFKRGEQVMLTLGVNNGYAPFTLTKKNNIIVDGVQTTQVVQLLSNYTPNLAWQNTNVDYAPYVFVNGNYSSVLYTVDDPFTVGTLPSVTTLEFAHRQVIDYTLTNKQVSYTSQPLVLPMTLNNDLARSVVEFVYVDNNNNVLYRTVDGTATTVAEEAEEIDGVKQLFVPTAVGEYNVRVFIRKDNLNFVTDDFMMNEDGEQVFEAISVNIIKGNAVIIAKATRSVYGDRVEDKLGYELQGVTQENLANEGISFKLALNAQAPDNGVYPVGTYQIVIAGLTDNYANYNVSFVSATHTISRREILIQTWQSSKVYGDQDPEFIFGVGSAQFEGDDMQGLLNSIFGGFGYVDAGEGTLVEGGENFKLYKAGTRISRMSGEAVGEYEYIPNVALFDINNNYRLTINNTQHFYITKRTVTLEVGGQSSVFPYGTAVDTTKIIPSYTLSANDRVVADDIQQLVEGKLSLATEFTNETDSAYAEKRVHQILLGAIDSANIDVRLGENNSYIIYIALQNAVTVSLADGESIELGYGFIWDSQNSVLFDASKFVVTGETIPAYTNIVWTASIESVDIRPNAGRHIVTISGAKLIGADGNAITDTAVYVNTFVITVNPAVITVSATVENNQKTYGDEEKVFGISYKIDSINDTPFASGDTFADLTYKAIADSISGSFARATYSVVGDFRAIGSRFDNATVLDNTVANTPGDYYGLAVDKEFVSSDRNFVVQANIDYEQRFIINPKEVQLHSKFFVGVNKAYDGTLDVPYSDSLKAYDLARFDHNVLVRSEDKLELAFTAVYDQVGNIMQATEANITFSNLSLIGDSACNYKLSVLKNDAEGYATVVGELSQTGEANDYILNKDTILTIYFIDNTKAGVDNRIKIYMAEVGLLKSDVKISKQYDNTKDVTLDCVQIADSPATMVLRQILNRAENPAVIVPETTSSFSNVNVSNNYNLALVSIFFPMPSINDKNQGDLAAVIKTDGDYSSPDCSLEVYRYRNVYGLLVKINNMQAEITKRTLDAKSFASISAVNRDYNGTPYVDTTFTFKEEALAQGDTQSSINLHLMARTSKGETAPGEYTINFAELTTSADATMTTIGNLNYTIDVDSLNVANELQVVISRAKLMPNVSFVNREYDNSTAVEVVNGTGTALTTLHYADNLKDELANFNIVGTVTYTLSSNGKADANVTEDLLHNVLVSGLRIEEVGGNNYLKNYEIYGERYANGQYNSVGSVIVGDIIADYELVDVVTISKKYVPIISNNVIIKDKVYDGTKDALVEVDLPEEHIIDEHIGKLTIIASGEFTRRQVGNNIGVSINSVKLVALTEEGNAFINNYQLADYKGKHVGNIVPKPIVLNATLGEKEYDGVTDIPKSSVTYMFDGILPADEGNYAIQCLGGAYYIDNDVNVERDPSGNVVYYAEETLETQLYMKDGHYYLDEACTQHTERKFARVLPKQGTIFNLKLANIKEAYINYVLTQASAEATPDYIAYKTADGEMHYYQTASADETVVEYYSPLQTTTKYIDIEDTVALNKAYENGGIVGFFGRKGSRGYIVKEDYVDEEHPGSVKDMPQSVVYFQAEGKINQRQAHIKSEGIKKTNQAITGTESAFTKQYDATKKFFGTRADNADGDGDFYYEAGSITNIIVGDNVEIEDVTAEFDSAETNAMYVVFTVSGIHGDDAYKYTTGGARATTRLRASIVKRELTAHLADGTMVYGTNPSNANGEITYSLNGKDITWVEEERSFFMNYKEYLVALGFIEDISQEVSAEDYDYLANSRERTYNLDPNTGLYVKANEGEIGEFIKFRGSFSSLPRPTATFDSSRPNAGDVSTTYKLVGGESTNFVFAYHYTGTTSDGTSELTVVKKDLYIAIQGANYTKVYGGADKVIELQYLDSNGNKGIVNGDTWMTLFRDGNVDNRPVAYLAIYNIETGVCTPADKYARISKDLGENEYYVYCLKPAEGVNYDETVKNYNVIFGDLAYSFVKDDLGADIVDDNGKKIIEPVFTFQGTDIKPQTAQLSIVLPNLTNVSVKDVNNTFVYDNSADSSITNIKKTLYGLESDDIVSFLKKNEDGTYEPITVKNVGTYVGYIKVERFVKIDADDMNGYLITWMSAQEISITIEKADINLKANPVTSTYTGQVQIYQMSGGGSKLQYNIVIDQPYLEFDLKIEKLVNGVYVEAELRDAGTYRLTITPNEEFVKAHPNETASSAQTTYTITRAVVNVTLDTDGFTATAEPSGGMKLTAVYDANANYDLDYTVAMSGDTSADIAIGKSDTDFILSKDITQPGRYSFDIQIINDEYNKENYSIVGGYGTIELSTPTLVSNNSGVNIEGTGVVANRLEVTEITEGHGTASNAALYETVKAYMPLLSKEAELDFVPGILAVVDLKLYCDNTIVSLEGKQTQMSVELPKGIDSMDGIAVYMVTEQGSLKRLTDYSIVDGNIEYTTDYLGALVFVDLRGEGIASWITYLIIGIVAILVLAVVVTLIVFIVKKSKLKKLM